MTIQAVFRSRWERLLGKVESPIEALFLEAFCPAAVEWGYEVAAKSNAREGVIVVRPQVPVCENYRADFVISYPFFDHQIAIVIECDGHQFHSVTKQQAARDRRRDRALQRAGYEVFRFTGSELHADARKCASEVLDAIMEFQTAAFVAAIDKAQQEAA
jgi:very-short-patch-repair endonuclease